MRNWLRLNAPLVMALVWAPTVFAANAVVAPLPEPKGPSIYLQCDGLPKIDSAAKSVARSLVLLATLTVVGRQELADVSKRLEGQPGVDACGAAIADESDPGRKVRLTLFRAIHHIEAKDFDAALVDARSIGSVAGPLAQDMGYKHSLMISGLEIEAASLTRLGRPAEAVAAALKMAAAAPYDVVSQVRAGRFVNLTSEISPEKARFLDRLGRLAPGQLGALAMARAMAGDFKTAALDDEARLDINEASAVAKPTALPDWLARASVEWALAGDLAKSAARAQSARAMLDVMNQDGSAANNAQSVTFAEDLLDLQVIAVQAAQGQVAQARTGFLARGHWPKTAAALTIEIAARLRGGANAEQSGTALARDPTVLREEAATAVARGMLADPKAGEWLYGAIRPLMSVSDFSLWTHGVWRADKSPYLQKKPAKPTSVGDYVLLQNYGYANYASIEALVLHCALLTRAQGKAVFVLGTDRSFNGTMLRYGEAGAPGFPSVAVLDVKTVIEALSEEFPDPKSKP